MRLSLAFGGLFALLNLLSAFWAAAPGDALDGGNRTVLYVTCFALFALTTFRTRSLAVLLSVYATGIAAVGVVTLARATDESVASGVFVDNRLSEPIGYVNATCALMLMAFLPAFVLASRRQLPIAARALLFGVAFVLVDLALLSQSRASLITVPITLLIAFALVPGKGRLLLALGLIGAAAALVSPTMLDVYNATGPAGQRAAASRALSVMALGFVGVVLAGLGLAWLDRRLRITPQAARRADLAVVRSAAAAALVLLVIGAAAIGHPVARVEAAWDEFNSGYPTTFEGSHFSGGLGDYRADYWRVALGQFRQAPLLGAGADNFAAAYTQERRFGNEAKFPHSTPLAIISSTGLLGAALFLGFIGCALVLLTRARRLDTSATAVESAALLVFAYWAVHGSVDWFWEIPGLGAPAFAFLGAAVGLGETDAHLAKKVDRGGLLVAVAAVVALVAATPAWLATRQAEAATVGWKRHPDTSLEALQRASKLNPLSERADLLAGTIANRSGRSQRALFVLERAISRNPVNWYAQFELAVAEASLGRRNEALTTLAHAAELNPREETIQLARDSVRDDEPVDLAAIDEIFRERVVARTE